MLPFISNRERARGFISTCAALLAEELVRFEGQTQAVEVKHATTLAFAGNQVLTGLLTHLQSKMNNGQTDEPPTTTYFLKPCEPKLLTVICWRSEYKLWTTLSNYHINLRLISVKQAILN